MNLGYIFIGFRQEIQEVLCDFHRTGTACAGCAGFSLEGHHEVAGSLVGHFYIHCGDESASSGSQIDFL